MLRKLAQAKDGDFIVKDKANEDVWNPSFLSTIPNNFDVNANDTTGTFGTYNYNWFSPIDYFLYLIWIFYLIKKQKDWKGYLESYRKEMKPIQEQSHSNAATGTFGTTYRNLFHRI